MQMSFFCSISVDDTVDSYNGLLVAKGFTQILGKDLYATLLQ